jgi:telomerase reverse transcriptase
MVKRWTTWIWDRLVVPLVRNHFYVDKDDHGVVSYFRKPYWRHKTSQVDIYGELGLKEDLDLCIGYAHRLRILPGSGRIISRSTRGEQHHLQEVLGALQWELQDRPDLLGASVTSFHQVFERLVEFKQRCPEHDGYYYFVKMDVKSAYHSIDQDHLWRLLESLNIFQHAQYSVHKFRVNGTRVLTRIVPLGETPCLPKRGGGTIISDLCWVSVVSRGELLQRLHDAIFNHHVLVPHTKKTMLQTRGVPQGSILSALLCSLYYADILLERHMPQFPQSLRMRWIDDTLFVTPSRSLAQSFLKTLEGLVSWNTNKSFLSAGSIVWCGLKIHGDQPSLEVTWDYSRYPEHPFKRRATLQKCLSLAKWKFKLHVLFSPRLNTRPVILFNAHQTFLYVKSRFKRLENPARFCAYFKFDEDFYRLAQAVFYSQ